MPPRPFPFPLNVGIDICQISRVRALIARNDNGQRLSRLARRIFNPIEQLSFESKLAACRTNFPEDPFTPLAQWMAGRFAAKEAAFKAVRSRRLQWHDVTIQSNASGAPLLVVSSNTASSNSDCDQIAQLSISHDGDYATAIVLAVDSADSSNS
ncbi:4'-phosphopantetheinyl transferase [Xylona heveae TC161]|uniref:4'-phosphopantetheinyl transferase n=1 Tax=Xylona heveae (strain CBS 132557 / TC161) TaxID=1328760 RepID=A0A161TCQ7_XYLHT|nr:4'-phosphopantetheinyl transferase [Xylona heveae TC161]KZF23587.1 4'-phosphopantetheinyl transferase [Xylona heveae TC161]